MNKKLLRPLAIYLPQFHPIPENDAWWGKGFTEWRNVVKARPRFKGHVQPHLPADLGFYDLRLPGVLEEQYALAQKNGIYGFMFYHYWFNGKLLLNTPIDALADNKKLNIPFCFCWANENWTRRWDGKDSELLLEQQYSKKDDEEHIDYLIKFFRDDRYIKVDGKPVLAVYRTNLLPNPEETANSWRAAARKAGFSDLYLINTESLEWNKPPSSIGFDAAMEFQPRWCDISGLRKKARFVDKVKKTLYQLGLIKNKPFIFDNNFIDYDKYVENHIRIADYKTYKKFPCLMPSWDNTSRRPNGKVTVMHNANPDSLERWGHGVKQKFTPYSEEENFLFINAWNEWAEGNHLEPCQQWGHRNLEAIKKVFDS